MQIGAAASTRAPDAARTADPALSGPGFRVPTEAVGAGGGPSAAAPARGLDALLALQENAAAAQDPATRDREARRHGRELLAELAALQKALLAGEGDDAGEGASGRLVALLRSMPAAADPGLGGVLRSVALRARLELARRGLPDVVPGCGAGDAIG